MHVSLEQVSVCIAEEKVKDNQGYLSADIYPCITSYFNILKPCDLYIKSHPCSKRLVNYDTLIVTNTIKTS